MSKQMRIGAVIYDPRVTVIWELFRKYFAENGLDIEPVFYKDYADQVQALVKHEVDSIWNSPLAWVDSKRQMQGKQLNGPMRDTDCDRRTMLIVRKESHFTNVADLKGKVIGFGAWDSPQARLIPIYFLKTKGLEFNRDYIEKRFDIGVGLHGDHVGGELDSVKALMNGSVDAAFCLDLNYNRWLNDGTLDAGKIQLLDQTPPYDHCIFCLHPDCDAGLRNLFCKLLYAMEYDDPRIKEAMDLEGLKKWLAPRTAGFEQLEHACEYLNFFDSKH